MPPARCRSVATNWPPGLRSASSGTRRADAIEVVDVQRDPRLFRNGEQMQHRVGRAAGRGHRGDRILERRLGQNLTRPKPRCSTFITSAPAARRRRFVGIDGRHAGRGFVGRLSVRSWSTARVRRALRGRQTTIASSLALVLASGTVVVLAVAADGYKSHDAQLNDGGIWVTSNTHRLYGRVNKPIGQMDGGLFADLGADLDVVQDGEPCRGQPQRQLPSPDRACLRRASRGGRRRHPGQRPRGDPRRHHRRRVTR